MIHTRPVVAAWNFRHSTRDTLALRPAETEAEYDELVAFADELTSAYNCNTEPYGSLFDLVSTYIDHWERQHYADLKDVQVPPHEMLGYYLEQRGVSQYRLAKDLGVSQGNVSAILRGDRGVSKGLAKKLAGYFRVSVEVFI